MTADAETDLPLTREELDADPYVAVVAHVDADGDRLVVIPGRRDETMRILVRRKSPSQSLAVWVMSTDELREIAVKLLAIADNIDDVQG